MHSEQPPRIIIVQLNSVKYFEYISSLAYESWIKLSHPLIYSITLIYLGFIFVAFFPSCSPFTTTFIYLSFTITLVAIHLIWSWRAWCILMVAQFLVNISNRCLLVRPCME